MTRIAVLGIIISIMTTMAVLDKKQKHNMEEYVRRTRLTRPFFKPRNVTANSSPTVAYQDQTNSLPATPVPYYRPVTFTTQEKKSMFTDQPDPWEPLQFVDGDIAIEAAQYENEIIGAGGKVVNAEFVLNMLKREETGSDALWRDVAKVINDMSKTTKDYLTGETFMQIRTKFIEQLLILRQKAVKEQDVFDHGALYKILTCFRNITNISVILFNLAYINPDKLSDQLKYALSPIIIDIARLHDRYSDKFDCNVEYDVQDVVDRLLLAISNELVSGKSHTSV